MKCPKCWADKAYIREAKGWQPALMACLLMLPMKCHHCYHRFWVFRLFTLGERMKPPVLRLAPSTRLDEPSYAARHLAAMRKRQATESTVAAPQSSQRADAA